MIYLNKILRSYRLLCRADISKTLWSRKLNVNVGNYPVFLPCANIYIRTNVIGSVNNRGSANHSRNRAKIPGKNSLNPSLLPLISSILYIYTPLPYTNITLATIKIIKHIGSVSAYDELPSPWCMAAGLSSATHNRFPSVIYLFIYSFNLFNLIFYSFSNERFFSAWFQNSRLACSSL